MRGRSKTNEKLKGAKIQTLTLSEPAVITRAFGTSRAVFVFFISVTECTGILIWNETISVTQCENNMYWEIDPCEENFTSTIYSVKS